MVLRNISYFDGWFMAGAQVVKSYFFFREGLYFFILFIFSLLETTARLNETNTEIAAVVPKAPP